MPRTDTSMKLEQLIYRAAVETIAILALAWLPMLGLGILHSRWPAVPAFGYWEVAGVWAAAKIAANVIRPPKPERVHPT